MRLSNLRPVARYRHKESGKKVNIYKGKKSGGWDVYFYYYRQKRIIVGERELFNDWEKVGPHT